MRAVRSHPGYELTFTLLNPQPDILDVQWDIEEGIKSKFSAEDIEAHSFILVLTHFIQKKRIGSF